MKRGDQCQGNYTFLLNFKGENKAGSVAAALSFHVPNFDFVLLDTLWDAATGAPGLSYCVCLWRADLGQTVGSDDFTIVLTYIDFIAIVK